MTRSRFAFIVRHGSPAANMGVKKGSRVHENEKDLDRLARIDHGPAADIIVCARWRSVKDITAVRRVVLVMKGGIIYQNVAR
jgi:hypothetical protein